MKNYIDYIKENIKTRFISIEDLIEDYGKDDAIDKIKKTLIGKKCSWVTKGIKEVKTDVINTIDTMDNDGILYIYFNGTSVNSQFSVELIDDGNINSNDMIDVTGIPSGEVIYMSQDNIKKLMGKGLLDYKDDYTYNGLNFKKIFIFDDKDYYLIKKELDPKFVKPSKIKYEIGDYVLCRNYINQNNNQINLNGRTGRIVKVMNDKLYLIQFSQNFSPYLLQHKRLYIPIENISKRLYINLYKEPELEEHELDDDYHIKQLFNDKKGNIKIGDKVKLKDNKDVLYSNYYNDFVDVWFDINLSLGEVLMIKNIKGFDCAKVSKNNNWYRIDKLSKE